MLNVELLGLVLVSTLYNQFLHATLGLWELQEKYSHPTPSMKTSYKDTTTTAVKIPHQRPMIVCTTRVAVVCEAQVTAVCVSRKQKW